MSFKVNEKKTFQIWTRDAARGPSASDFGEQSRIFPSSLELWSIVGTRIQRPESQAACQSHHLVH